MNYIASEMSSAHLNIAAPTRRPCERSPSGNWGRAALIFSIACRFRISRNSLKWPVHKKRDASILRPDVVGRDKMTTFMASYPSAIRGEAP